MYSQIKNTSLQGTSIIVGLIAIFVLGLFEVNEVLGEVIFDENFDGGISGWSQNLELSDTTNIGATFDPCPGTSQTLPSIPNEPSPSSPNWGFVQATIVGGDGTPVNVVCEKSFTVVETGAYSLKAILGATDCDGCVISSNLYIDEVFAFGVNGEGPTPPFSQTNIHPEAQSQFLSAGAHTLQIEMATTTDSGGPFRASFDNIKIKKETPIEFILEVNPAISLTSVADVTIDSSENVFALASDKVKKISPTGILLLEFGEQGSGDGQFINSQGISLDSIGNIYVADSSNHRIQKFDSTGTYVSQFGTEGSGDGQFNFPRGIILDESGNIYVADGSNHRIQKFDSSGTYVSQFGTQGSGDGQFNSPAGIAIDEEGNIFVADIGNHRIQKFDSSGTYVSQFGTQGSEDGELDFPQGVTFDSLGNIYVADSVNNRVQKFNSNGTYVSQFGTQGSGDGQFTSPQRLALDSRDNIYVADTFNDRIQKFGIPCNIPGVGDMTIILDCILVANETAPESVFVQEGALLTIPNGLTLSIPSGNKITVEQGSGVLIKDGGTLEVIS